MNDKNYRLSRDDVKSELYKSIIIIISGENHNPISTPPSSQTMNGTRPKKTSLFRRHSFNLQLNKEKSPASSIDEETQDSSSLWYEADIDSDVGRPNLDNDCYSYSDSEGGFQPLRSRLRGLLGSFGKGTNQQHHKKKLSRSSTAHPTITTNKKKEKDKIDDFNETIGEFTRQIENLSTNHHQNGLDRTMTSSSNSNYFSAHDSSTMSNRSSSTTTTSKSRTNANTNYSRMKYHKELAKNDSNDTFTSSMSSTSKSSNRNSVMESMSSESYHDDDDRDSDEEEDEMSKRINDELTPAQRLEKKVYYIAREIMTSERVFVDVLRLINVEFREFLQKHRRESKHGILSDSDFSRIFSNLPELQTLNEDLLQDFEDRVENWDTLKKIADVIVKKGPFLKLYTTYIREFSAVNYHFDECIKQHPKFAKLVREFEKGARCRNLKVKHFMLKPVQRLPQYKLLLEDYLKHLDPESIDFDDTTNALRIVSEAAEHANDTIRQGVSLFFLYL